MNHILIIIIKFDIKKSTIVFSKSQFMQILKVIIICKNVFYLYYHMMFIVYFLYSLYYYISIYEFCNDVKINFDVNFILSLTKLLASNHFLTWKYFWTSNLNAITYIYAIFYFQNVPPCDTYDKFRQFTLRYLEISFL